MEDLLKSKGLYRLTLGIEVVPVDVLKRAKWDKQNDSAHRLIGMLISNDLKFHLQGIETLDVAWMKLEIVLGEHNHF